MGRTINPVTCMNSGVIDPNCFRIPVARYSACANGHSGRKTRSDLVLLRKEAQMFEYESEGLAVGET